jgi:hypothetical protein
MFFDGGLARFDAFGQMVEAVPSAEAWRDRPVAALLTHPVPEAPSNSTPFSPLFVDPLSGRPSLFIHSTTPDDGMIVGTVSLEQLGLTEVLVQARNPGEVRPPVESTLASSHNPAQDGAIAFLVDAAGRVIYHPYPPLVGQDFKAHEGVAAVKARRERPTIKSRTAKSGPLATPRWPGQVGG